MPNKKIDTTIDAFINIVKHAEKDPKLFDNLIKSLETTIPLKNGRRSMSKIDQNVNRNFQIKRINYIVTAKIIEHDERNAMYTAKILSIDSGESRYTEGSTFPISARELQLTGRKVL